jgi:hypothetical protein
LESLREKKLLIKNARKAAKKKMKQNPLRLCAFA